MGVIAAAPSSHTHTLRLLLDLLTGRHGRRIFAHHLALCYHHHHYLIERTRSYLAPSCLSPPPPLASRDAMLTQSTPRKAAPPPPTTTFSPPPTPRAHHQRSTTPKASKTNRISSNHHQRTSSRPTTADPTPTSLVNQRYLVSSPPQPQRPLPSPSKPSKTSFYNLSRPSLEAPARPSLDSLPPPRHRRSSSSSSFGCSHAFEFDEALVRHDECVPGDSAAARQQWADACFIKLANRAREQRTVFTRDDWHRKRERSSTLGLHKASSSVSLPSSSHALKAKPTSSSSTMSGHKSSSSISLTSTSATSAPSSSSSARSLVGGLRRRTASSAGHTTPSPTTPLVPKLPTWVLREAAPRPGPADCVRSSSHEAASTTKMVDRPTIRHQRSYDAVSSRANILPAILTKTKQSTQAQAQSAQSQPASAPPLPPAGSPIVEPLGKSSSSNVPNMFRRLRRVSSTEQAHQQQHRRPSVSPAPAPKLAATKPSEPAMPSPAPPLAMHWAPMSSASS